MTTNEPREGGASLEVALLHVDSGGYHSLFQLWTLASREHRLAFRGHSSGASRCALVVRRADT